MRRALELAERGWGRVAPNPLVGAVVVREGEVVGEGWHAEFGKPHAEVGALSQAGERARGATLFVTLEPCSHHGKTPACTEAVLAAGISELVYACPDPNPDARGGAEALAARGVRVRSGIEGEAARALNAPFFRAKDPAEPSRPWIELKLAMSLDARIADSGGVSQWITGEGAREEVHRLRAGADAIAVGIGTVLADDPSLTVRGKWKPRRPPVRIIFDRQLRLPLGNKLLQTIDEAPVWVVTSSSSLPRQRQVLETRGVRVILAEDLASAAGALFEAEIHSIFCEGGAGLSSALLAADLVDRLTLFYAPLLLGPSAVNPFGGLPAHPLASSRRWRPYKSEAFGRDTMISLDR